ncbi:MAG TPA: hypothetical protein VGD01_06920 [Candidatus Elarobacter sp.]|jgi:hypothetical protein
MTHRARALIASAAILVFAGCGGGGSTAARGPAVPGPTPTPPPPPNAVRFVLPGVTDPAISNAFGAHLAVAPGRAAGARLVVFLPGTNATPADYSRIVGIAADAGAHAIGLSYPDTSAILQDCGDDPDCYLPIRLQKFDGVPRSPIDAVAPADAIVNRLTKLLLYLDAHFPSEGWGAFVGGGAPVWSSIIVGGHSQGAGEAATIGKVVRVARVAQFSGTVDAVVTGSGALAPATWVPSAGVTPAAAYYGFDHTADVFYDKIRIDWTALGQDAFGPAVAVESAAPPYGGSHDLITSLAVNAPHPSTAADGATPLDANGAPLFAPVWRYVFGL